MTGPEIAALVDAAFNETSGSVDRISRLTKREREVLKLIGRGRINQEIADALCIEKKTVENHVSNIFEKLQVRERGEAIVYARVRGVR